MSALAFWSLAAFLGSFWLLGKRIGGWRWSNGPPVKGLVNWILLIVLLGSGLLAFFAILARP